jgi:hypothetical protein
MYTLPDKNDGESTTLSTAHSGLGMMLNRHIREVASDEELMVMMENCVTRVEVSSLEESIGLFTNYFVNRMLCLHCIFKEWINFQAF